jgi:hypothetical protein
VSATGVMPSPEHRDALRQKDVAEGADPEKAEAPGRYDGCAGRWTHCLSLHGGTAAAYDVILVAPRAAQSATPIASRTLPPCFCTS